MITIDHLSIGQLKRAIEIREQIQALQNELSQVLGGEAPAPVAAPAPAAPVAAPAPAAPAKVGKGKMSAEGRAAIAAAQRARWAKVRGTKAPAAKAARGNSIIVPTR